MQSKQFTYLDYQTELSAKELVVRLNYRLDEQDFQEIIRFPLSASDNVDLAGLSSGLTLLHLICGISYYKAGIPPKIELKNYQLNELQAEFFNETFFLGLQEFAYRNQLDLRQQISFPFTTKSSWKLSQQENLSGAIIPMGGGKDSMLCLEILKSQTPLLLTLGSNPQVQEMAQIKKLRLVEVVRTIDPRLLELNRHGALNGHVPFSAILGAVCVVAGLIYKKKYLVLGNERSANEANLEYLGTPVNHQYSKSFHFEQAFNRLIKTQIASDLEYFSLLRQFSEATIARQLAKHEEYLSVFASCNVHKKITADHHLKWCGSCAKCCFVFLCLSPFLDEDQLLKIFGENLFEQPELLIEFQRLTGLLENKPWECVGEYAECRELFRLLIKEQKYHNSIVVKEVAGKINPKSEIDLFDFHGDHLIPEEFKNILDEYLRAY